MHLVPQDVERLRSVQLYHLCGSLGVEVSLYANDCMPLHTKESEPYLMALSVQRLSPDATATSHTVDRLDRGQLAGSSAQYNSAY